MLERFNSLRVKKEPAHGTIDLTREKGAWSNDTSNMYP